MVVKEAPGITCLAFTGTILQCLSVGSNWIQNSCFYLMWEVENAKMCSFTWWNIYPFFSFQHRNYGLFLHFVLVQYNDMLEAIDILQFLVTQCSLVRFNFFEIQHTHSRWNDTKKWLSGPRLNIKTVLSTYGDFHVKDKTAVRTSYL